MWFAVRDLGSVFDLIATGLPALFGLVVLGMVVYAAARRRRLVAVAAVSCLLAASVAIAGPWRPRPVPPPVRPLRIVAANVSSANPNVQEAALDALNQGGDLVLLFEFGAGPLGRPPDYGTVIRPTYSNQVYLSRFPARLLDRPQRWPKRLRAHRLEIDAPTGRVVVYVTHLVRPFVGPRRILRLREQMTTQRNERDALLASARTETAPVVLAGDFNTSDRTIGYRRITSRFRDAMRAGWGGPTYVRTVWRPFLLRIDHIFVPRDWCSARPERFALHGSDHRGLAVDVGPCPNL
jgi:endonuclease/exonuclease/phosphatase (EEP) superfamily protein YafD